MRIFLAGAAGIIGRSLVPLLIRAGHEVAGTTRSARNVGLLQSLGARPVVLDVYDRDALFAALRAERPDAVIHQLTDLGAHDFAANTHLRIVGTRNLMDAALAVGVRRVIAQSLAWVYAPGEGLAHEDEPLDPNRPAFMGVQALEQAVAEADEGVILRYGLLYGPGTWYASDGPVAEQVRRGALPADDTIASFLHVEDAAQAALAALGWPPGPVNIVDDEPAPAREWLPVYAAALGSPPPPITAGNGNGSRGTANTKARRERGWQPRYPTWREGFRRALG